MQEWYLPEGPLSVNKKFPSVQKNLKPSLTRPFSSPKCFTLTIPRLW